MESSLGMWWSTMKMNSASRFTVLKLSIDLQTLTQDTNGKGPFTYLDLSNTKCSACTFSAQDIFVLNIVQDKCLVALVSFHQDALRALHVASGNPRFLSIDL
ncbi:hypothetical protein GOODEAATRI_033488 [Goodea atripinnis]|uniref:Uncharacterized protein n=1 Tax=Goodea atripinnis TaxID=208336 RepID=A0ABV0MNB8_9TELE